MTETLKYRVLEKEGNFELRQYADFIQAEVDISGSNYRRAMEAGFGLVAGYIFGNNISRRKIEMTTPVIASKAEKIAMTTPVIVSGAGNYTVAFVMPTEYTMDTLPEPKDNRVRLRRFDATRMAAIRFNGYFNQEKIDQARESLSQWLAEKGLEPVGDFIVAGYNPPWVPGFLARNEVLVRVKSL